MSTKNLEKTKTKVNFFHKEWKIITILTVAVVAFVLLLPLAFYFLGRYPARISVDSVPVGFLTKDSALDRVKTIFEKRNEGALFLTVNTKKIKVKPLDTGVRLDWKRTLSKLESTYFKNLSISTYARWVSAFYLGASITPEVQVSRDKLLKFKSFLDSRFGLEPQNASVYIDERGKPHFKREVIGRLFSEKELLQKIRLALVSGKAVRIEPEIVLPEVSYDDVKKLVQEQLSIFEEKLLVLFFDDLEFEIKGEELKKMLSSGLIDGKLTFVVRPEALLKAGKAFFNTIERNPENASFEVVSGKVVVLPEKKGLKVDATKTAEIASRQLLISQKATVEVVLSEVEPEITAEEAKGFGIKELISSFTTEYNPNQLARVSNIKLLARLLDGQLIAPGEVFSFNERIGPRTLERGFKLAPTIVNGKLVDTAGGGACQVGTTLFNAAFFAGLKIVERHNHSFFISHYPAGRDATVSYGGYDLKFKNDYESWILIKAYATQSRITISFYGTSEGRKVRFVTEGPFDIKPYKIETIEDPALPAGVKKVEDKGISGRKYVVIRYVYDRNGNLLYKDRFTSNYRPKVEIVRVGAKKLDSETTAQTTQVAN